MPFITLWDLLHLDFVHRLDGFYVSAEIFQLFNPETAFFFCIYTFLSTLVLAPSLLLKVVLISVKHSLRTVLLKVSLQSWECSGKKPLPDWQCCHLSLSESPEKPRVGKLLVIWNFDSSSSRFSHSCRATAHYTIRTKDFYSPTTLCNSGHKNNHRV